MTPEERIEKIEEMVRGAQEDDVLENEPVLKVILAELDQLKTELKERK